MIVLLSGKIILRILILFEQIVIAFRLICVVPPGVSITTATVAVLVTAGKLVSTSVSLSVYGAPFISSIFPETFDSAGVDTLTVYGTDFYK